MSVQVGSALLSTDTELVPAASAEAGVTLAAAQTAGAARRDGAARRAGRAISTRGRAATWLTAREPSCIADALCIAARARSGAARFGRAHKLRGKRAVAPPQIGLGTRKVAMRFEAQNVKGLGAQGRSSRAQVPACDRVALRSTRCALQSLSTAS
jgi:hypothetical protein